MNPAAATDVTVAVLAGGLGTRLRGAAGDRPKVLAEVNGRPFLSYLLDQIADAGFEQVVLCTGFRAAEVEHQFGAAYGTLHLRYSAEPVARGTGGALHHALPLLESGTLLVLNGDSFVDADLRAFWQRHVQARSSGSLLLVPVPDVGRYGQVEVSSEGRILSFREKQAQAGPGLINAGVYFLDRNLLESIPPEAAVSLERDCFPRWLSLPLHGMTSASRFLDIGTPESYRQATAFFQARPRPTEADPTDRLVLVAGH